MLSPKRLSFGSSCQLGQLKTQLQKALNALASILARQAPGAAGSLLQYGTLRRLNEQE